MSVVDEILARYDMKWELSPYRIVNKHGVIVQMQHFDLRDSVLKAQSKVGFNKAIFQKPYPDTI